MDTLDRLLLASAGIATAVAGWWALVTGLGATDKLGVAELPPPGEVVAALEDAAATAPVPWWALVLPVAVLAAALGLWLTVAQLRSPPGAGPVVVNDTPRGRTTLRAEGVAGALARDAETVAGVRRASATIHDLRDPLVTTLRVRLTTGSRVAEVRAGLEAVLQRLTVTMDADTVQATLIVDFGDEPQPRVR